MTADKASLGRRLGAAVAGAVALVVAARFTLGCALVAPIAMAIASLLVRRRGGTLTRGTSWAAAVAGVFVVMLAGALVIVVRTPSGAWVKFQHTADSAAAVSNTRPPPEWVQHLVPGAAAAARRSTLPPGFDGHSFTIWTVIIGGLLGTAMLAIFIGTLGWAASLPLAYALRGRWFAGPPPLGPPRKA